MGNSTNFDEEVTPMRIDDLMRELEKAKQKYGNLDIKLWVSWFEGDDTELKEATQDIRAFPHKRLGKLDFIISGNGF